MTKPYYRKGGVTLYQGKVETILPQLAGKFDACLCDPPYGLTANKKGGSGVASIADTPYGRSRIGTGNGQGGFMGAKWDASVPGPELWATMLGALKPGAMLLAFGGTRTHHRLMCAIEDAGFEIRDCLMWLYGSGFPKSLDISKAIDKAAGAERRVLSRERHREQSASGGIMNTVRKPRFRTVSASATSAAKQWEGYGTALKPAWEPIVLAMKPCDGTFAENALKHGVAGLSIDKSRIGDFQNTTPDGFDRFNKKLAEQGYRPNEYQRGRPLREARRNTESDESRNAYSKGLAGSRAVGSTTLGRWPANVILDEASGGLLGEPSRFFYCAKAGRKERGTGNTHPTVKPLKLGEYLARLILPPSPDAVLVIPFAGSGSEILGAQAAGWRNIVAIEANAEYCDIITARLGSQPRQQAVKRYA